MCTHIDISVRKRVCVYVSYLGFPYETLQDSLFLNLTGPSPRRKFI